MRYLEPEEFTLIRTASGGLRMTLKDDRSILRVKVRRCFPFAFPPFARVSWKACLSFPDRLLVETMSFALF